MLFELPDSLITCNVVEEGELVQVINELLSSVLKSEHEVRMGYNLIGWLLPKFTSLRKLHSLINYHYQNWSTTSIPAIVSEYVRIVLTEAEEGELEENGRKIYKLWYKRFLNNSEISFKECRLVCENNSDCNLYHHIGNWFCQDSGCIVNLRLSYFPGGGVTTEEALSNSVIRDKTMSLCIVDSDFRWPNAKNQNLGQTAKGCKAVAHDKRKPYVKVKVLKCMESENLIPLRVIDQIKYKDSEVVEDRKNRYVELLKHGITVDEDKEEIAMFYDIKNGYEKNDNFWAKPKYRDFVKKCLKYTNPGEDPENYWISKGSMEKLIPGIKGDILDKCIEWLKDERNRLNPDDFFLFQKEEWREIGQYVVNYGCSRSAEAIN